MQDSFYLYDKQSIYTWASQAGATLDNDGTLHIWVQPAIGTKSKVNDQWIDDGNCLMSLQQWKDAKTWYDPSTFYTHYNKELKVKIPTVPPNTPGITGVRVKYQTLDNGDCYNARQDIQPNGYYNYNIGSIHTYADTGIISHIDWSINNTSKRMILVGVEVTKRQDSQTGTSGLIVSNIEGSNHVYPGKQYSLRTDAMADIGQHANNGSQFSETRSDIYNLMKGQSFRSTFDTTITYLYAEFYNKSTVYPAMLFKGYETMALTGAQYVQGAGTDFNYSASDLVSKKVSHKNAIFELVRTAFYKADASNLLRIPSTGVTNRSWNNSSHDYNLSSNDAWTKDYNANTKLLYTAPQTPETYEYLGTYQVRAPQIELCYYKDDLGKYHLFSATTGGKAIDTSKGLIDQYKRNVWINNNATTSCTVRSILRNQQVDGVPKDMVLTNCCKIHRMRL